MPVFLKISNNNRAETVFRAFIQAVEEYGVPKRVRPDKGSENIKVAEYMFQQRGIESKPFIAGTQSKVKILSSTTKKFNLLCFTNYP